MRFFPDWQILLGVYGAILVVIAMIGVVWGLIKYVFQAIGLYRIAKRREVPHAWFAWVPLLNDWLLGSISDQFQYVVKGKMTHRRVILLILAIVAGCGAGISLQAALSGLADLFYRLSAGYDIGFGVGYSLALVPGISALITAASIASLVFQCMALYDLYSSCNPANNVLFLVLGIIFPVTVPFFLFSCRNLDIGMPPRRY